MDKLYIGDLVEIIQDSKNFSHVIERFKGRIGTVIDLPEYASERRARIHFGDDNDLWLVSSTEEFKFVKRVLDGKMTPNEYQRLCMVTAGDHDMEIYAVLGLAGEAGEVADLTKKWKFHGHPYDRDKFLKELGDIQWYLAITASAHGFDLEEVMQANIKKLQERYPGGFSSEKSINRTK